MLTEKESVLDRHGLREETKSQGTPDWFALHQFRATSTLTYHSLPKSEEGLIDEYLNLLTGDLGFQLTPETEDVGPPDLSYQQKSLAQLVAMAKATLVDVTKSYGRPYSGTKQVLAERIKMGPVVWLELTAVEKMLKHTFMKPLSDKEKTPHKIGSLNEAKVRNAIESILLELGFQDARAVGVRLGFKQKLRVPCHVT